MGEGGGERRRSEEFAYCLDLQLALEQKENKIIWTNNSFYFVNWNRCSAYVILMDIHGALNAYRQELVRINNILKYQMWYSLIVMEVKIA